jgi:hypothetical protein
MNNTASELISFYNGQTDGFPHVKQRVWKDNNLVVWLDPDYLRELSEILPYTYLRHRIPCFLCFDGSVCVPEFNKIFESFGINAEDVEPKI